MQVHDKVICVFAGDCLNVETHGIYKVTKVYTDDIHDMNIDVSTLDGKPCGTYNHKRFMTEVDVLKQQLENVNV